MRKVFCSVAIALLHLVVTSCCTIADHAAETCTPSVTKVTEKSNWCVNLDVECQGPTQELSGERVPFAFCCDLVHNNETCYAPAAGCVPMFGSFPDHDGGSTAWALPLAWCCPEKVLCPATP